MPDSNIITDLIQFGLSGLIIYIIVRPVMNWFMRRTDEKDEHIKNLVENHFKHDEERHNLMIAALEALPRKITNTIAQVYKPEIFNKGAKAYDKILKR